MSPNAEILSDFSPDPIFPTLTETWLNITQASEIGITFHHRGSKFFSYANLFEQSKRVASFLITSGVRPQTPIAIVLPTCAEFVTIYFGILLVRAIPAPVYPPMGILGLKSYKNRTKQLLTNLSPQLTITSAQYASVLEPLIPKGSLLLNINDLATIGDNNFEPTLPSPYDIALIQHSSGTTNTPKPIALSHHNIMTNLTAISFHYMAHEPPQLHNVSWLPLYHDLGLIGNLLMPILWNCPNDLMHPQDFIARPWLWLQLISKTKAFSSSAPNFAYALCCQKIQDEHMEGVNLEHWQWGINGAELINPKIIRDFEDRFSQWGLKTGTIVPAYGLAESVLAISIGSQMHGVYSRNFDDGHLEMLRAIPNKKGKPICSVGTLLAGTSVRIVSTDGSKTILKEGEIGEISIKSDSVMSGYFHADQSLEKPTSEWFCTGDLGFIFENRLYLCGRIKNLIIKNGRNFFPHQLEQSVETIKGIRKQNTLAVSNLESGQETIYIFAELEKPPEASAIPPLQIKKQIVNKVLEEHGIIIDHVVLVKRFALPRTSSGKLRHQYTLKMFRQGELAASIFC